MIQIATPSTCRRGARRLAVACLAIAALGCEGDFDRPDLDAPGDPASGLLPPTPTLRVNSPSCVDGAPRMIVEWDISSEVGVVEYEIFRSNSADTDPGDLLYHVPAGIDRITDTNVVENALYFYRVRARDGDGRVGLRSSVGSQRVRACE